MTDSNNLTIIGRLTKDAEMKLIEDLPLCFFTIATNKKKKDVDEAYFFDINVYGRYAEMIIERLKKGVLVCIEGSLKQERWKDKATEQNRSRVLIIADSIQVLGGRQH